MSEKSSFDVNCAPPFLKNSLLAPYMPYGTSLRIIEHLSSSVDPLRLCIRVPCSLS